MTSTRDREDDRIIREMLAPAVTDAVEALGFWLRRHARLPLHRRAARAEARRMIRYWQGRLVTDARRDPVATVLAARSVLDVGRLAVGYHSRRALQRLGVAALAIVAVTVVATSAHL
jgi:hypothetical protein